MKIKPTTSASILLVVVFSLIAAWQLIPAAREVLRSSPYLSVIVIQLLIIALPSVFYCTLRGKEFRAGLRINFFPLSAIILIVSGSVLIVSGSGLIGAGMNALFPEAFSASSSTPAAGAADSFYYVIAFAVVPAITEEVLFRGIILTEFTAKELQVPVFLGGELVYDMPGLKDIQKYCKDQMDTMWDSVKRFDNPHNYYVDLSPKLWDIKYTLLMQNKND